MIIDFDELNPGAKFDFEVDGKGKSVSWVKVRAGSNEIMDQIREQCISTEVEYKKTAKHGQLQRIEYTKSDNKKLKEMLWDYTIMDWSGFFDKANKPIPCTTENKIKFMSSMPAFYAFVDKCLEKLTPDVNEAIKESEKN